MSTNRLDAPYYKKQQTVMEAMCRGMTPLASHTLPRPPSSVGEGLRPGAK